MDTTTPSPDGLAWAQRLVRFNTVSHASNLPLIECIADHLRTLGVPLRLTWDEERRKANLFATLGVGQARRPGAVGPHRHRALGRPGLAHRPAGGRGARRPPVRPRQRRHEGLDRPGGGADRRLAGSRPALRAALRLQLRRRGGRLRCAPPHRRPARRRPGAAAVHRRRAHGHGAGDRAQGRAPLALLRARQGGAFLAHAAGRECGGGGGAAGGAHRRYRRRTARHESRVWPASTCPTPPPRCASSKAASPTTWCPRTAASTTNSATCRAATPPPCSAA